MKRYLFVSHSSGLHGAERCLLESVLAFKQMECCEIIVIVPNQRESEFENLLRQSGAIVVSGIDNPWWVDRQFYIGSFIWRTFKATVKVLRILYSCKPDYVIINSIVVNPAFAMASRLLGIKSLWYIHELGDVDHGWRYLLGKSLTFKIIALLSDRQAFNSLFTAHHFEVKRKVLIARYAVIMDMPSINAIEPLHNVKYTGNWNIVLVGRTAEGKGQSQIIEAANLLLHKHSIYNFTISIVGLTDCEYSRYLFYLVQKYQLTDNVEFIPFGNRVLHYLSKADIGVTTSLNESFGRITVEYLKSGLLTIGASCGGTQEILNEFDGVYQYEPGNIVDLVDKMRSIFGANLNKMASQCHSNAVRANEIYNLERHHRSLGSLLATM